MADTITDLTGYTWTCVSGFPELSGGLKISYNGKEYNYLGEYEGYATSVTMLDYNMSNPIDISVAIPAGEKAIIFANSSTDYITFDRATAVSSFKIVGGSKVTDSNYISLLQSTGTLTKEQLSIDLTTLSGWSSLSSGTYDVYVKSKGKDVPSDASESVSVEKAASGYTINSYAGKTDSGANEEDLYVKFNSAPTSYDDYNMFKTGSSDVKLKGIEFPLSNVTTIYAWRSGDSILYLDGTLIYPKSGLPASPTYSMTKNINIITLYTTYEN